MPFLSSTCRSTCHHWPWSKGRGPFVVRLPDRVHYVARNCRSTSPLKQLDVLLLWTFHQQNSIAPTKEASPAHATNVRPKSPTCWTSPDSWKPPSRSGLTFWDAASTTAPKTGLPTWITATTAANGQHPSSWKFLKPNL